MRSKIAFAEIRGTVHRLENVPCQDKTAFIKDDNYTCIALADGAGSRVHSHIGAKIAVDTICDYFKNNQSIEAFDKKELLDLIVKKLMDNSCSFYELSSTLIFVFISNDEAIIGHLGDGFAFGIFDNDIEVLSYPENGEEKNITYFTTDNNALDHLRTKRLKVEDAMGFLLTSDGGGDCLYSNSDNEPANAIKIFNGWLKENDEQLVCRALESNLIEIAPGLTHDDVSVIELYLTP